MLSSWPLSKCQDVLCVSSPRSNKVWNENITKGKGPSCRVSVHAVSDLYQRWRQEECVGCIIGKRRKPNETLFHAHLSSTWTGVHVTLLKRPWDGWIPTYCRIKNVTIAVNSLGIPRNVLLAKSPCIVPKTANSLPGRADTSVNANKQGRIERLKSRGRSKLPRRTAQVCYRSTLLSIRARFEWR